MNDPELRKFFRGCAHRAASPPEPTQFSLVVTNPAATGGQHGVRVLQQRVPYQRSRVVAERVTDSTWQLTTANVQRLAVRPSAALSSSSITIDGELVGSVEAPTEYCWTADTRWAVCTGESRGPNGLGPMRRVFESRYLIVYGAAHGQILLDYAVFIANLLYDTGDGRATVVSDETDWESATAAGLNLVFIGGARWNRWAAELVSPQPDAMQVTEKAVSIGQCEFAGTDIGVAALRPLAVRGGGGLGLVLDGTSLEAIGDVVGLATPTIPPMVRQPFSNTLPDYVVTSAEFKTIGAAAFLAAGFWGNDWEWRSDIAYSSYCHRTNDFLPETSSSGHASQGEL